jgi:hypothetical protein
MAYLVAYVCQLVGDDDCEPSEKRDHGRDGVQRLFWHLRAPRDQKFQRDARLCYSAHELWSLKFTTL